MTGRRRTGRPADPLEAALRRAEERSRLRDPATWGFDRDALELSVNADVGARKDLAGRVVRARRQDVFDLLSARGGLSPQALTAVRRLQDDIARLHQSDSVIARYAPKVDVSRQAPAMDDRRRRAGLRVASALRLAGPASARLLSALCEQSLAPGSPVDWRETVRRETGERLSDAQGAIVRMACENLAGAYAEIDRAARSVGDSRAGQG